MRPCAISCAIVLLSFLTDFICFTFTFKLFTPYSSYLSPLLFSKWEVKLENVKNVHNGSKKQWKTKK